MIEKLSKLLLKKYGYKLESHKVCFKEIKRSRVIIPAFTLFLIIAVIYFTTEIIGSFVVIAFAFFILVLIPLALRKGETYNIVIITPDYLIQQTQKKDVVAMKYDRIKRFNAGKKGVTIKDSKNTIFLEISMITEDILTIMDILEAKGKTFDKTKDYMIRPIKVIISNNEVKIVDVKLEESSTEKIVSENYKDYAMLTPGFIKDIILMNSVIDDSYIKENNLYIKLSRLEVKPGHPENIMFESQVATDCIIIFENVKIFDLVKKEARGGSNEKVIDTSLENLVGEIEKGVISDWKYREKEIDLQISVGLFILNTSFEYDEVIIGWNTFN
jgi:hypothetical protein